jgi:hypothetical protein
MSRCISEHVIYTLLSGRAVQVSVTDYEYLYFVPGSVINNNTNGTGILIAANTHGSLYWKMGDRINMYLLMQHGFPYSLAEQVMAMITEIVDVLIEKRNNSPSKIRKIDYDRTKNTGNSSRRRKNNTGRVKGSRRGVV